MKLELPQHVQSSARELSLTGDPVGHTQAEDIIYATWFLLPQWLHNKESPCKLVIYLTFNDLEKLIRHQISS